MNARRSTFLCVLLFAVARTSLTSADDTRAIEEARRSFDLGIQQYRSGDAEGARISLTQSYATFPSNETLRDLAIAELESGHTLDALAHFKKYGRDSKADPDFVRSKLPGYIQLCNQHVGHLRVVGPADLVVTVDGRRVYDLREPVDVLPGEHTVATRTGEASAVQTVHVAATQTVDVELIGPSAAPRGEASEPSAPVLAASAPDPSSSASTWWTTPHVLAVGLGGVAVVGAVTGVALFVSASDKSDRASTLRAGVPTSACSLSSAPAACGELRDVVESGNRDSTLSTVSFVVAGGAAVGALGLLLLTDSRSAVRTGAVTWMPSAMPPSIAGLVGTF
jgi:hypothetical protein